MIKLKYGNTNTFYIPGTEKGILVDTDYAGTINSFYKAIKNENIKLSDIAYILATHYHPDHIGLVGELMEQGIGLIVVSSQAEYIYFSEYIFEREAVKNRKIDVSKATVITCEESRTFLKSIGIDGEIIVTDSHSPDSISLILDNGDCFVGDLEPYEYIDAYDDNRKLKADWDKLRKHKAKKIYYAHANEKSFKP